VHITKRYSLALFIGYAGLANFALFMTICAFLGGSAGNGTIRSGHFYVGNHGRISEVSEGAYRFSQIHEYTVFITLPLGIAALAYANSVKKRAESYPFPPDSD
jgi:hypothetical protein